MRHLRRIVHERVENSLREATILEEVSRLRGKRDDLSAKRGQLQEEKGAFDRIKQQRAKELSNEIMRAVADVENLTTAIEAHAEGAEGAAELAAMKARRREVQERKRELEEDKRTGQAYFSPDEEGELTRVDDALDALDTEADYLGKTIGDLERELGAVRANAEALSRQTEGMTLLEAKHLVGDLMSQLVLVKGEHSRAMHRVNRMDVALAEKEQSISDLGGTVRLLEMSTDKRVSEIKKAHVALVQQMASGGGGGVAMGAARVRAGERDGIGGARPLRSKGVNGIENARSVDLLDRKAAPAERQQQRASSARAAGAPSASASYGGPPARLDRRVHQSLKLDGVKPPAEKTIRVSKSQVRPLSAADMQQRRAARQRTGAEQ